MIFHFLHGKNSLFLPDTQKKGDNFMEKNSRFFKGSIRILCMVLAIILYCMAHTIPPAAIAASNSCGDNATWSYDGSTATLTIQGSGGIIHSREWDDLLITHVVINPGITVIQKNTFYQMDSLETASLPYGLKTIENNAFFGASSLAGITIPDTVISIGAHAFDSCSNLKSISLSSSLESIGKYCFQSCNNLDKINLPEGLKTINAYAFCGARSLTELSIPDTVTQIGIHAFSSCTRLKAVSYPDSLDDISAYCFAYCSSLSKINIPRNLKTISDGSFNSCTSLKKISLPEKIYSIGKEAFYGSGLTTVKVPSTVKEVGSGAFAYCLKLKTASFLCKDLPNSCFEECSKLYDVKLSSSVKTIGSYALSKTGLESFKIPKSVTSVGSGTFAYCRHLEELQLSGNITSIPSYFITGTKKLKDLTIPKGVKQLKANCFRYSYLRNVTVPESVTYMHNTNFYGCSRLRRVNIQANVRKLGDASFSKCHKLKSVNLGAHIKVIGEFAFSHCESLKAFPKGTGIESIQYKAFLDSGLEKAVLPDSMRTIDYWAFRRCNQLETIYLGAGVKTIRENSFSQCNALQSYSVSSANPYYSAIDGVLFNRSGSTLYACPKSRQGIYTLPSSVNTISITAFNGCVGITEFRLSSSGTYTTENGVIYSRDKRRLVVCPAGKKGTLTLPSGVTSISTYAFSYSSLRHINLPSSLQHIEYCAFQNCLKLKGITIPGSVTTISNAAFWKCKSLRHVTLNYGTKKIGRNAFFGCRALHKFKMSESINSIHKTAFNNTSRYRLIIYCKKSSYAMTYAHRNNIKYRII